MSFGHKEIFRGYTNGQLRELIADPENNDAAAIAAAKYILEIERKGEEPDIFEGLIDAVPAEDIVMARWKLAVLVTIAVILTCVSVNMWSAYKLYDRELGMNIFSSVLMLEAAFIFVFFVVTAVLLNQRKPWGWILFYIGALLMFIGIFFSIIIISTMQNVGAGSMLTLLAMLCWCGTLVYVFFQRRALNYFNVGTGTRTRSIIVSLILFVLAIALTVIR